MPSMSLLLLFARLLLCAVFLVAGLAKLADLAGSRQAMRDFGVPDKLADFFGLFLPLAELAVAVSLVVPLTGWWGAVGALALLLIFVAGIGYNLAQGRTPDCHCFGQLHSAPAGWSTLIRNLVLAGVAGLVVGFGRVSAGPGVLGLLAQMTVSQRLELLAAVVVLVVLIGEGWLLVQTMTQQGRLLLRIEALENRLGGAPSQPAARAMGLAVGTPAPAFDLSTLDGETMTVQTLRSAGKPFVLLFTDPGCGPCTALLPEIGQWQREHAAKMRVALVSRGTVEANRAKVTKPGVTHVLLQKDREVAQAYQAHGTPSAVVVRQDGTIGSPVAQGVDAIRGLISATLNGTLPMAPAQPARPPPGLKIGEPAPDFSLPDLAGQTLRLSDFRGNRTLVLFWRPSCGFCARMLPDLKAWETNARNGAPKLLVVSTDSVADNQAMGLRSPVVLDKAGMSIGKQFGATGTPMAVLIDGAGKIASELAAGAPAVLELAGREQADAPRIPAPG
jgi:peroxiredoxin